MVGQFILQQDINRVEIEDSITVDTGTWYRTWCQYRGVVY